MALWTPYTEEQPLDLTKPVVEEQAKEDSLTYSAQYCSPVENYPYSYASPYGYLYPQPPQMSPTSSSTGSYEQACVNRATMSPPDSPPSGARPPRDSLSEDPGFVMFERDALRAMAEKNGGSLLGNNPRMRRSVRSTSQNAADESYKTQRQKNNMAAKQSRDRRKLREINLALKVTYLSNEVARLKALLAGRSCARCQHQL